MRAYKNALTEAKFDSIKTLIANNLSNKTIASALNYTPSLVSRVKQTATWKEYVENKEKFRMLCRERLQAKIGNTINSLEGLPEVTKDTVVITKDVPTVEESLDNIFKVLCELRDEWKPRETGWKLPFNK